MRRFALLLIVPLLLAAKCDSTKEDEDEGSKKPKTLLSDKFNGTTIAAHWTQSGAGTMMIDATGNPAPAALVDPSGAMCELDSNLLEPIYPDWQAIAITVDVAIDGTVGSGAFATIAIEDDAGADIASMTISDGQVQVVTPGTYSVTQLWTTDAQFHRVSFLLYANGLVYWTRMHGTTEQISPIGSAGAVTGVRLSLRGGSTAPAWFDNVNAFVFGETS